MNKMLLSRVLWNVGYDLGNQSLVGLLSGSGTTQKLILSIYHTTHLCRLFLYGNRMRVLRAVHCAIMTSSYGIVGIIVGNVGELYVPDVPETPSAILQLRM